MNEAGLSKNRVFVGQVFGEMTEEEYMRYEGVEDSYFDDAIFIGDSVSRSSTG